MAWLLSSINSGGIMSQKICSKKLVRPYCLMHWHFSARVAAQADIGGYFYAKTQKMRDPHTWRRNREPMSLCVQAGHPSGLPRRTGAVLTCLGPVHLPLQYRPAAPVVSRARFRWTEGQGASSSPEWPAHGRACHSLTPSPITHW